MDDLTFEHTCSFYSQATRVMDVIGLFSDILSMGVCTTRHWQTSGRPVQELNVRDWALIGLLLSQVYLRYWAITDLLTESNTSIKHLEYY